MLADHFRQLLTAYVDGELSARQRRHVVRLLRRSAQARDLLQRLQHDSRELRGLPRPHLERDLSDTVLATIAARRLTPGRRPRRFASSPASYPAWAGVAAAAAVLLLVGAASYAYFAHSLDQPAPGPSWAKNHHQPPSPPSEVPGPGDSHDQPGDGHPKDAPPDPKHKPDKPPRPADTDVAHDKQPSELTPAPKDEPIVTSPVMELFTRLETANPNVAVPVTFKLRELEQEATHKKLLGELQKDADFRLELPCTDGTRAFEHLQTVAKGHHVNLVIEQSAQRRLALTNPKWKTNYVLYTEDLTADELAHLLQQLVADEKKPAGKLVENPFDQMVLTRMTDRDHKELSELLGIDPVQMQPTKATGPLGVDLRKPLADQTAEALAGQGTTPPRPEPGKTPLKTADKPADKPIEHTVLAMAYNPVRPKPGSAEVKHFLDNRKPLRPGALQVLLVLRGPAPKE